MSLLMPHALHDHKCQKQIIWSYIWYTYSFNRKKIKTWSFFKTLGFTTGNTGCYMYLIYPNLCFWINTCVWLNPTSIITFNIHTHVQIHSILLRSIYSKDSCNTYNLTYSTNTTHHRSGLWPPKHSVWRQHVR